MRCRRGDRQVALTDCAEYLAFLAYLGGCRRRFAAVLRGGLGVLGALYVFMMH